MLENRRVVVIGGSSGLGLAVGRMAAEAGAKTVLVGRDQKKLEVAAGQVNADAEIYVADIAEEASLKNLFHSIGPFDHLVTTAANLTYAPLSEFGAEEAQAVISSKLLGPFYAVKHALPFLSQEGSVTFFGGVAATKPGAGQSLVAAVNGGLEALARALAVELAPVRVNTISPGAVETPSWTMMSEGERRAFFASLQETLPVRRNGTPEDLAQATLFLMTNRFTTGTTLHVDGGTPLV